MNGISSVIDSPRPGQAHPVVTPEAIAAFEVIVKENRRVTVNETAAHLVMSHGSAHYIVHDKKKYLRFSFDSSSYICIYIYIHTYISSVFYSFLYYLFFSLATSFSFAHTCKAVHYFAYKSSRFVQYFPCFIPVAHVLFRHARIKIFSATNLSCIRYCMSSTWQSSSHEVTVMQLIKLSIDFHGGLKPVTVFKIVRHRTLPVPFQFRQFLRHPP